MKRCRYILCTLVLLMIMTVLAGCHAEYNFTLKVTEDTETEYMLDILIPISEDSPDYGERSWPVGATQGTGEPDTQPQIALYDSEGYRSMLVHYRRLMGWSVKPGKTDFSLNGVRDYLELCERYQTFRIALVDLQGNVLQVSEEYDFQSGKQSYLKSPIEYDPQTNTALVQYKYRQTGMQVFRDVVLLFLSWLMPLPAIAGLITLILFRLTSLRDNVPRGYHALVFLVPCLPSIIYLGCKLYEAFQYTLTDQAAWEALLHELDIPAKRLLWFAAPWLVLLVFIIWFIADVTYRKMKGKTGRSDEPKCSEPSPEKESES
ncbi:hypothetical protein [uncultured Ruminococcus sp.]|uniref:hypothetical protein n=1 Tax=uncultured Ruminococcus sp. TaxID=165186 RepID=UPI0025D003C1|nr:hypothetical protein [uncultured Ruminococcus sp.]